MRKYLIRPQLLCIVFTFFVPMELSIRFETVKSAYFFVNHLCYFCLVLLCFHARLYVDALWPPAGKGLTS